MYGTKKEVQELVKLGAFPETADNGGSHVKQMKKYELPGKSPLFLAAERGRGLIIDHLLENFATGKFAFDIDMPDKKGDTCLHAAVRKYVFKYISLWKS